MSVFDNLHKNVENQLKLKKTRRGLKNNWIHWLKKLMRIEALQILISFVQQFKNFMQGGELNIKKGGDVSKSSLAIDQNDPKKLREIIEEKDTEIRKLNLKIAKLKDPVKKGMGDKNKKGQNQSGQHNDSVNMELLERQMKKAEQLEQVIEQLNERIALIIDSLSKEKSLQLSFLMESSKNGLNSSNALSSSQSQSMNQFGKQLQFDEQSEKNISLLQKITKVLIEKSSKNKNQIGLLKESIKKLESKLKSNEDVLGFKQQLKEERQLSAYLKSLLQKSEAEKKVIVERIANIGLKEFDYEGCSRQQLVRHAKQLKYKVKDLQSEKGQIIKAANKDKAQDQRKYEEFLFKLKNIKEKSIMAKSRA